MASVQLGNIDTPPHLLWIFSFLRHKVCRNVQNKLFSSVHHHIFGECQQQNQHITTGKIIVYKRQFGISLTRIVSLYSTLEMLSSSNLIAFCKFIKWSLNNKIPCGRGLCTIGFQPIHFIDRSAHTVLLRVPKNGLFSHWIISYVHLQTTKMRERKKKTMKHNYAAKMR